MRKQLQDKTTYKPNDDVKIVVDNKPVIDDTTGEVYMYDVTVTLKRKKYSSEKALRFASDDELVDYIHNIDLDDHNPQMSLLDDDKDKQ